jgi:hypothetical protein
VSRIRFGEVSPWLFTNHPMGNPPPPEGYPWGLPLLYLVWVVAIVMLYLPCRWFAGLKAGRKDWWLSYRLPAAARSRYGCGRGGIAMLRRQLAFWDAGPG